MEVRIDKARTPVIYLRCLISHFCSPQFFAFLFRQFAACFLFFSFFCFIARSFNYVRFVDDVDCSACLLLFVARRTLRETTAVSDGVQRSIEGLGDVVGENVQAFCVSSGFRSRGVSHQSHVRPWAKE